MSAEANKQLVRRLVEEAVRDRNLDVLDELAAGEFAALAKRWVSPFRSAFPDFEMEIVDVIAEDERVVAHFRCSGTHLGEWLGVPGTGRRFENVDEIYIFRVRDGRLVSALGVEDNLTRLRQLGITPRLANSSPCVAARSTAAERRLHTEPRVPIAPAGWQWRSANADLVRVHDQKENRCIRGFGISPFRQLRALPERCDLASTRSRSYTLSNVKAVAWSCPAPSLMGWTAPSMRSSRGRRVRRRRGA